MTFLSLLPSFLIFNILSKHYFTSLYLHKKIEFLNGLFFLPSFSLSLSPCYPSCIFIFLVAATPAKYKVDPKRWSFSFIHPEQRYCELEGEEKKNSHWIRHTQLLTRCFHHFHGSNKPFSYNIATVCKMGSQFHHVPSFFFNSFPVFFEISRFHIHLFEHLKFNLFKSN